MQPEALALLWDTRHAAGLVLSFVGGRSFDDYQRDLMLQSAVERQFQVIGEALNRLSRVDPTTAAAVTDLPRIVAFRNVLVHGYATVDDALVWDVATTRVQALAEVLDRLLAETPET